MTRALTVEDFRARTREEFRARLMALVLTAVLVWYTLVVPPYAPAPRRAGLPHEDEGADGEVRQARGAGTAETRAAAEAPDVPVEELDWPEFIGLD
jgi:hypothetical protein